MTSDGSIIKISQEDMNTRARAIFRLCEAWMLSQVNNNDFDNQYCEYLTGRTSDYTGRKHPIQCIDSNENNSHKILLDCEKSFKFAADMASSISSAICSMKLNGYGDEAKLLTRVFYFSREWQNFDYDLLPEHLVSP